jgi:hypothetical protein
VAKAVLLSRYIFGEKEKECGGVHVRRLLFARLWMRVRRRVRVRVQRMRRRRQKKRPTQKKMINIGT